MTVHIMCLCYMCPYVYAYACLCMPVSFHVSVYGMYCVSICVSLSRCVSLCQISMCGYVRGSPCARVSAHVCVLICAYLWSLFMCAFLCVSCVSVC